MSAAARLLDRSPAPTPSTARPDLERAALLQAERELQLLVVLTEHLREGAIVSEIGVERMLRGLVTIDRLLLATRKALQMAPRSPI